MRNIILGLLIVCWGGNLKAQKDDKYITGKVSYVSSQNVYVKFESTENLKIGDTLFLQKEKELIPVLVVNNLSSTSCVCTPISQSTFSVSMPIIAKNNVAKLSDDKKPKEVTPAMEISKGDTLEPVRENKVARPEFKQKISGSITATSYSNFSNITDNNSVRFRYQFSLNARNIANSKFSFESYAAFQHEKDNWALVQENIFKALKVYNLSVKYDNNKNTLLVLGRKINPKISSMGAIDGIQYEARLKNIYLGAIAGSRPNYADYSFDFNLPQFGVYAGHTFSNSNGEMQSSFALVEQMNASKTDRRFAYFQHSNSLLKNLYYFGTLEIELYKNMNDKPENTFNLSSAYFLLQYKLFKKLTLSTSFDNRKNVIYYETYKSYINQLLEIEARQGVSLQASYYPFKNLSLGAKAGYRFPNANSKETRNLYGYISLNNISNSKISATGAVNYLETSYVNGRILNLNIYRDFFKGNLYADCGYQLVDYRYVGAETTTIQNIINLSLSWRFFKNNSLSVNYENAFEKQDQYSRLSFQIRKRF